jgi:hypothetical protein
MKNLKKVALGLMVGAMAMSFSAFTSATKFVAGDVYGNKLNNGTYSLLTDTYRAELCDLSAPVCAYVVTTTGATHVSGATLTPAQITTALSNNWIVSEGNNGIYSGI